MGTFTCLNYHLVFSTKGRLPLIRGDVAARVIAAMLPSTPGNYPATDEDQPPWK